MQPTTRRRYLWIVLPLALVLLILLFFPFRYRIEFDTDEGVNAIKAMMVLRGYRLYSQIWSDQPPLFTFLLAAWFRLFGLRLTAGRILVLLFSAGLVALAAAYLRKNWGLLAAACGVLILALLPFFLRLSVSLMIGLPAIALAFASFYALAEWHAKPSDGRLAAAGALLGVSILIKGFTAVLIPIWLAGMVITVLKNGAPGRNRGRHRWVGPAAFLAALGIVVGLGLVLAVRPENLGQLVSGHFEAARNDVAFSFERRTLNSYLAESFAVFCLAALGVWRAVRRQQWSALYLLGWIVAGYGLLAVTGPTWYHHQLLVTVPAALLAAIATAASTEELRLARVRRPSAPLIGLSLLSIGFFFAFLVTRGPGTAEGLQAGLPNLAGPAPDEEEERSLIAAIGDHASEVRWLYTDRPIFAFLTDLPIPPNLAVITQKRVLSGDLTEEEITDTLEAYSPEMILNWRFGLPAVEDYMRTRNYTRIDDTRKYRLYLRRNP